MNIAYVCADNPDAGSLLRYRCMVRSIARTGRHTAQILNLDAIAANPEPIHKQCGSAEVIVVQAANHPMLPNVIQGCKARDKTVILDLAPDCYPWLKRAGPPSDPAADSLHWSLRLADALTIPSKRLAEDLRGHGNLYVIPDFIELDQYLNIAPVAHEGIILGWKVDAPGLGPIRESGIPAALANVCKARPQVKVGIWGRVPGLMDCLGLSPGQIFSEPGVSLGDWPRPLAYVDIGLVPVLGPVDDRRGWKNVLELMVMRIPWLASQSSAYYELRPYGWLVQNDHSAWERLLLDMIDHLPAYREEAMGDPYIFGIGQGIDENIDRILSVFATIADMKNNGRMDSL